MELKLPDYRLIRDLMNGKANDLLTEQWTIAFEEYNNDNKELHFKMDCRNCYIKVYQFIKKKYGYKKDQ